MTDTSLRSTGSYILWVGYVTLLLMTYACSPQVSEVAVEAPPPTPERLISIDLSVVKSKMLLPSIGTISDLKNTQMLRRCGDMLIITHRVLMVERPTTLMMVSRSMIIYLKILAKSPYKEAW